MKTSTKVGDMARITVLGGTGYAGSHIVAVAAERGHDVTAFSRNTPEAPVAGVTYRTGDVTDSEALEAALTDADVLISALSPRGALEAEGKLRAVEKAIADQARDRGIRFGVIGGAGSLRVSDGGPLLVETDDFPEAFRSEAREMASVLDDLRASNASLDWFFVSPSAAFGAHAPGEAVGSFRLGGDLLILDANGASAISGPDLALAVLQEIEHPAHRRERFTVGY